MWAFWAFLVLKVHSGLNKMRKKKFFKGKPIWPFPFEICEPNLSNLLPLAQAFSNPATRWRSSMPDPCKTLLISTWTKVLKDCIIEINLFKQSG